MEVFRRVFEGQVEQLAAIHEFVDEAATELGLGQDDAFACRLAVDEAATNAFEHAYAGQRGKVEVTVQREANSVELTVRNWGASFEPDKVPEPRLDLPLEKRSLGGLGIYLMRKYMDHITFTSHPQDGNSVTMQRELALER